MGLIDETNNVYGDFRVVKQHKGSIWLLECQRCGHQLKRKGTELRRYGAVHCPACCSKCGKKRDESFKGNTCKDCRTQQIQEWKDKNPEKYRQMLRSWHRKCPTETKRRYRETEFIRIQSSPRAFLKHLVQSRRRLNNQRQNSFEFTINLDLVLALWDEQAGRCAISGLEMEYRFNSLLTVSIDRIDSSRGYVAGNVQLVCKWANLAKGSASNIEMLEIVQQIRSTDGIPKNSHTGNVCQTIRGDT